jgi:hypothetical protein
MTPTTNFPIAPGICGMSPNTTSTSLSSRVSRKPGLRDSRSSGAATSFGFCFLQTASALRLRPRLAPAALDVGELAQQLLCPPVQPVAHSWRCASRPSQSAPAFGVEATISD